MFALGTYGLKHDYAYPQFFLKHDPTLFTQSWIVRIGANSMSAYISMSYTNFLAGLNLSLQKIITYGPLNT